MRTTILFAAVLLATVNCNAQFSFAPGVNYSGLNSNVNSIVSGDFNNDGKLDIAGSNHDNSSASVSLFIGDGQGGLAAPVHTYLQGTAFLTVIAAADFNKDGNLDLTVGNKLKDSVNVLYGDGTGNFPLVSRFGVANYARSVATADLNRDGYADIVSASSGHGGYYVSVLLNNGVGGFGPMTYYPATGAAYGVVCNDFDNDDKTDIATANYTEGGVNLLLGNGNGTFSTPMSVTTGSSTNSICAADLNNDGNIDIVTTQADPPNISAISVLLGNGQGGFAAPVQYNTGTYPSSVACADLNNDNKLDLAVANNQSGDISVFPGDGNGGFASPVSLPVSYPPYCLLIADLNSDGKKDLITGNLSSVDLTVLLNTSPTTVKSASNKAGETVSIFPNPCRDAFRIISEGKEVKTVDVLNVLGTKLLEAAVPANGIIDINGVPPGTYFLNLHFSDNSVAVQKILVY